MSSGLHVLFLLSGLAALVYEIAWQKMLVPLFGASLYAVATVTSLFLAGLALGAYFSARNDSDDAVGSLRMYAAVELSLGACAAGVSFLLASPSMAGAFARIAHGMGDEISLLIRFLIAGVLILLPTSLMGMSFPLIVRASGKGEMVRSQAAETMYAINVIGACCGCLLAGFVFLPQLGLLLSCLSAAAINVVISICAFGMSIVIARYPEQGVDSQKADPPASGSSGRGKGKSQEQQILSWKMGMTVAFIAGAICLSLEVAWTRWFQMLAGSSSYSLTIVLATVLAGLAIGAVLAASVLRRLKQPLLLMSTASAISAIYMIVLLYAADEMPWLLVWLLQVVAPMFGTGSLLGALAARCAVIGLNVLVPSICMGVMVPMLVECVSADKVNAARRAGSIYAANTLGTICGALLTGFVLIPGLATLVNSGIQVTLMLAILAESVLSIVLFTAWAKSFITDPDNRMVVIGIVAFIGVAVIGDVALFRPSWNGALVTAGASLYSPEDLKRLDREMFLASRGAASSYQPNGRVNPCLFYREGVNSAVSVESNQQKNLLCLKNDGKTEAAIPIDPTKPAPDSDVITHAMLGSLPVLIHKDECKRVLVIGYGSGCTTGTVTAFPGVDNIKVAELEGAVLVASRLFNGVNGYPLRPSWKKSGRVNTIKNDGRYVLFNSTATYDAIVSQPADPWVNGSSELFTRQFWQLGKSRLAANGIFCQWIQLYSLSPEYFGVLCRTFSSVFPNCLLLHHERAGECVLIGINGDANSDRQIIAQRLKSASIEGSPLAAAGFSSQSDVLSDVRLNADGVKRMCEAIGEATRDIRLNTDDNMIVEHAAAANSLSQRQNIDQNIEWIKKFIH